MKNESVFPRKRKPLRSSADGAGNGNGLHQFVARDGERGPKSDLEQAIQRYVDLFDFAPIGYVSFDRVGRIEEINLAATQLLGKSRARLMGSPFALCVAKQDAQLFLEHLLHCRASDTRVDTELHLNGPDGKRLHVQLSSTPAYSLMKNAEERFCGSVKIFYPDGRPMPHDKCPMARVLRGDKLERSEREIVVERASGVRRHVFVTPVALQDARGKIIGAINCLHDIT